MEKVTRDDPIESELLGASESDTRRSLRDMGALLALRALWVDHEPAEIATGLLSVLFGVLRLDGAFARFNDPDGGAPRDVAPFRAADAHRIAPGPRREARATIRHRDVHY